jgi:hypothetical protein
MAMKVILKFYAQLLASILLTLAGFVLPAAAQSVDGLWDATVTVNNVLIPFRLEISGQGSDVRSFFFNGDEKVNPSTEGTFRDATLLLKFASYGAELKATLKDETLTGSYEGGPGSSYPFEARRHNPSLIAAVDPTVPRIDGRWEIQVKSPKRESAWHCVVKQSGASVSAAILRVDGDTGTLSARLLAESVQVASGNN